MGDTRAEVQEQLHWGVDRFEIESQQCQTGVKDMFVQYWVKAASAQWRKQDEVCIGTARSGTYTVGDTGTWVSFLRLQDEDDMHI